ncbi:gliding motility-associated C-terminal domain-containing protein [Cryomorphaceae bacterium 1068]|nr:gliding motility-associated C-terminal domain-containing protein [Cryomorphaceae bacterium 1068]
MKDQSDLIKDVFAKFLANTSLIVLLVIALPTLCLSQNTNIGGVINSYTPVTQVGGPCSNQIEVESISAFSVGDRVLLIQMQGAEIDLTNGDSFGEITDIASAGFYEFGTISLITAIQNTINLENQLVNEYDVDGKLQLVLVPQFDNATVTSFLFAPQWNGETGGVLALEVEGTLSMEALINCSGQGFRGGEESENYFVEDFCASQNYFFPNNPERGGSKGESIALLPQNGFTGRGAPANGGGGGNNLNAGGGGGSNFGAGGTGGNEWSGCTGAAVGGRGGKALDFSDRLFLGGGGGGGHQNDGAGTPGQRGGGIVFIQASDLVSNGFSISADGRSVDTEAGIDGAGGAGGGGTIVLDVGNFQDEVDVSVKGGEGGSVNNNFSGGQTGAQCHGPGGGGGGGAIAYTSATIPTNTLNAITGGESGLTVNPQSACQGDSYGAVSGLDGTILTSFSLVEGTVPAETNIEIEGNTNICAGNCTVLLVTGAFSAFWEEAPGLSEDNTFNPTVCPEETTTYSVSGVGFGACNYFESITINVFTPVAAETDLIICDGDSAFLGGSFQNSPGLYTDTLTATSGCDSLLTTNLVLSPFADFSRDLSICNGDSIFLEGSFQSSAGVYTDTLFYEAGCDSIISTTLSVVAAIEENLSVSICSGDSIFIGGAFRSESGQYTDTLTGIDGCDSLVIASLMVNPIPLITAEDVQILPCQSAQLFASGGLTYSWSPDSTLSCANCPDPIATPSETTTYVVNGTIEECTGTATVLVSVEDIDFSESIKAPNIFTPNGDGLNDFFQIELGECIELIEVQIFNRWGQVVFESSDSTELWDGESSSEMDISEGLYFYLITFRILENAGFSDQVIEGSVTILR